MQAHGQPIRYHYVHRDWPISTYQTVFATEPGSAEMPSAARPFTTALVTELVARGVGVAPLVLHTGVSSGEVHEPPYPERYRVGVDTAERVNATHANGGRVIAIGTTVVRALEATADEHGRSHPGSGWTDLVIEPQRAVRLSTVCSQAGTNPRRRTCSCSRQSPVRRCRAAPTNTHSMSAIGGTSSATSTSFWPNGDTRNRAVGGGDARR